MNGVLDAQYYLLPETFYSTPKVSDLANPLFNWYKSTIASFRLTDYMAYLTDFGRHVIPFLVVRDTRSVWSSLRTKHYGRNGTSAEDPPLRLRFRRFLEDWEFCRQRNIPMLQFERFVGEPRQELMTLCRHLGLPWDEGMVEWNKPRDKILDTQFGNPTFLRSKGANLLTTVDTKWMTTGTLNMAVEDLRWLEGEFAEFNKVHGYAEHVEGEYRHGWDKPDFKNTKRYRRKRPLYHLKRLLRPTTSTPSPKVANQGGE